MNDTFYTKNIECRDKLNELVSEKFDGFVLHGDPLQKVMDEYGENTVMMVLAKTVQENIADGRYRPETKEWANSIQIPQNAYLNSFGLKTHPEIVNGLVNQFIKAQKSDNSIYDKSYCVKDSIKADFTQKLLLLRPELLKSEYRKGKYQLFYAESGFGCKPETLGSKIFGFFFCDDENTSFRRSDFMGIADVNKLPLWAVEKLNDISKCNNDKVIIPEI